MVLLPLLSYIGLVNVEEVWDKQPSLDVGVAQEVVDPSAGQVVPDASAAGKKGDGKNKLNAEENKNAIQKAEAGKDTDKKDLIILEASELRTQVDKSETLQIRGMTYQHVNVLTVAIQAEHAQHS